MGLLAQWKGVTAYMVKDSDAFFAYYDEDHGVGYPLAYILITAIVAAFPLFLLISVFNVTDPQAIGVAAAITVVFAFLLWLAIVVEALVLHALLFLFGNRGVVDTLEAFAFPSLLRIGLWWFPIVNLAVGFWGWYLQIKGVTEFHDSSNAATVAIAYVAAFLSVIVFWAILFGLVIALGTFLTQVLPSGGTSAPVALVP